MKLRYIFALLLIPAFVIADGFVIGFTKGTGTTTVAGPSSAVSGYLDSIRVDITGTTTGTLSIAKADGEVIFTNTTAISADTTFRPRVACQSINGVPLATTSSTYERVLLVSEKLTVTLTDTAPAGAVYAIKFSVVPVDK